MEYGSDRIVEWAGQDAVRGSLTPHKRGDRKVSNLEDLRTAKRWLWSTILLVAGMMLSGGCASYRVGHRSLYRPDIRTIHVPVFESESLRPNLGERLTEAVVKEIEARTPYKVVGGGDADSVLSGRIVRERKRVTVENRFDDARNIETELTTEVSWISRRGEVLMQRSRLPLAAVNLQVSEEERFIPEAGQTWSTSQQAAIERLAAEIVGQMEIWW